MRHYVVISYNMKIKMYFNVLIELIFSLCINYVGVSWCHMLHLFLIFLCYTDVFRFCYLIHTSVFPPHKEISYFKERYSLSRRGGSNKHNINIYLFIYNMPGTLLWALHLLSHVIITTTISGRLLLSIFEKMWKFRCEST